MLQSTGSQKVDMTSRQNNNNSNTHTNRGQPEQAASSPGWPPAMALPPTPPTPQFEAKDGLGQTPRPSNTAGWSPQREVGRKDGCRPGGSRP